MLGNVLKLATSNWVTLGSVVGFFILQQCIVNSYYCWSVAERSPSLRPFAVTLLFAFAVIVVVYIGSGVVRAFDLTFRALSFTKRWPFPASRPLLGLLGNGFEVVTGVGLAGLVVGFWMRMTQEAQCLLLGSCTQFPLSWAIAGKSVVCPMLGKLESVYVEAFCGDVFDVLPFFILLAGTLGDALMISHLQQRYAAWKLAQTQ